MAKYRRRKRCRSYGEKAVKEFLEELGVEYIREKTFPECKSPKNRPLRFDFFLPHLNVLIEYQGIHHYEPANKGYRAKISHRKTVHHDSIKRQFAQSKDMQLLCIPHWELQNVRDIMKDNIPNLVGDMMNEESNI